MSLRNKDLGGVGPLPPVSLVVASVRADLVEVVASAAPVSVPVAAVAQAGALEADAYPQSMQRFQNDLDHRR